MKLAALLLGLLTACGSASTSSSATPPTGTTPTPTEPAPMTDAALTPDGRHFAAVRVYEGNCAPKGSRGGCYTLTLNPDGTMGYFMLDAGLDGTYVIEGNAVVITPTGAAVPQRFELSADRSKAGDLLLKSQ